MFLAFLFEKCQKTKRIAVFWLWFLSAGHLALIQPCLLLLCYYKFSFNLLFFFYTHYMLNFLFLVKNNCMYLMIKLLINAGQQINSVKKKKL